MTQKLLLTLREASELVSVSVNYLRAENAAHRIRFVDVSGGRGRLRMLRVELEELERWRQSLKTAIPKH